MCVCVALLLPASAGAQVMAHSGAVIGTVSDEQGGRLVSAMLSLADVDRGVVRRAISDGTGEFRFPLLPPARYRLDVQAAGFSTRSTDEFDVFVGEAVSFEVMLPVAGVAFSTDVTAVSPGALNPTRVAQASVIESVVLDSFPINRRNYLDFALLAPGVTETTTITDQADFRVSIAPTSGLSFAGNNGRGNVVLVDGISNNGATGNVRPSVPQEAVQEFQVNRSSYSAEYGGGLGGVVNIVTRSGGSDHHGTVFALVRDRRLDARNYFDPGDSAFTRVQTGAAAGGPLRRTRTFYFGAIERLDRHETVFVPVLRDASVLTSLPSSQERLLNLLTETRDPQLGALANALRFALTPSNNPEVVSLVQSNSGTFPLDAEAVNGSLRLDHRVSDGQYLMGRVNFTTDTDRASKFGALVGHTHGSRTRWRDQTLVLADTYVLSPRWVGVTRVSVGRTRFDMIPNDPVGPELLIGGFGTFGRDNLLPFVQRERYVEIQQAFSYASPRHSLKAGVVLNPIHNEGQVDTFFGGRFVFAEVIPLGFLIGAFAGDPALPVRLAAQLPNGAQALQALAEPLTALQAYSLGLPVAYVQAFGNSASESTRQQHSAFVEYTLRPISSLSVVAGVRPQYNSNTNLRSVTYVEPRIGSAWSPDTRTVVRAGYGVYHSWVDLNIAYSAIQLKRSDVTNVFIPLSGVPAVPNPLTGRPVTSADVYGYMRATGVLGQRAVTLFDLAPLGIDSRIPFPVTGSVQEDYTSPQSRQASVEIERALAEWTVGAGYMFTRSRNLWRTRDHNLVLAGRTPNGQPIFGPANPALFNNFVIESAGRSRYDALVLQANRRFARRWSASAHYTLSRAEDDVTDFNIDYAPHNQLDPGAEWGPSPFAERHRLVTTAFFQSPAASAGSSTFRRAVAEWDVAAIARAHSGRPFNVLTGFDNMGDGQANTHRPLGLGRNAGRGPAFLQIDMRLTKRLAWRDAAAVELTLQVFNVLNRTNFASVNNVVGAVDGLDLPRPITGRRGDPVTPLAFTAAHAPRQLELGVRVRY